jgi:thioredoxin reductase (NADPH)
MMKVENVTIIGAGPAGLSTAIQLKRHGIDPLLLERDSIGGVLRNANRVENYPGFPNGISGPDLVDLFETHAGGAHVEITYDEVRRLDFDDGVFVLEGRKETYRSRVVVIASGTRPRTFDDIDIPGNVLDRVFYEIYPLFDETGKKISIVGAGDAAFDYALNLADRNSVMILNRGSDLKCLPLLWERSIAHTGIDYSENVSVTGIERGDSYGLRLDCSSPEGRSSVDADYLIGAIGRTQNLDFMSKKAHERIAELAGKGLLYFAGDVRHGRFRQTAIAVGDGILTAMTIHHGREEPPR